MSPVRYYTISNSDDIVHSLARVRWDEAGMHGEVWRQGEWIENVAAIHCYQDGMFGEQIDEDEALEVQRLLQNE